jgi:redox-sensitive bicupin YhaK (pirin superfamily)
VIVRRPAAERGATRTDWLDSRHTFSFGGYRDPRHMGFHALRVINEDVVRPGGGFAPHHHEDMEILTWVLTGALAHRDSLGNGSTIRPGEAQRMSAGTGIDHSEMNPSRDEPVHFLQIWILPERTGLAAGYEQRTAPIAERKGEWVLVASRDGREGSITVHQDVSVWAAQLAPGDRVEHFFAAGRDAWLQVARGTVAANGERLAAGDGLAAREQPHLVIEAETHAEVLLFDLAA